MLSKFTRQRRTKWKTKLNVKTLNRKTLQRYNVETSPFDNNLITIFSDTEFDSIFSKSHNLSLLNGLVCYDRYHPEMTSQAAHFKL